MKPRVVTGMNKKISGKNYVLIASMLFGLFFGAGNLIFPIIMGARAGANVGTALIGMLVTAVGIPLLGIISMGISRSEGLMHMSGRVSKAYSYFFTCALYLTIGPLFAIPRCAAVSFTVGVSPLLGEANEMIPQLVFTTAFFALVLFFSLKPSKIMDSVGRLLNPIFLVFLGILMITALVKPVESAAGVAPQGDYVNGAFFAGFLQGYDTLDALASLAFGIVVINVIRGLGVTEPTDIAKSTVKSGVFSMILMAAIYAGIAIVGAQSYGLYAEELAADPSFTGGDIFAIIARHYFGETGGILLALTATFCCMKTAVGLVTSCSETFTAMFGWVKYRPCAIALSVFALLVSNIGLNLIIKFSAPVLYFLYPLAIVLILLSLFGRFFDYDKRVMCWTIGFTAIAAALEVPRVAGAAALKGIADWAAGWLPLYSVGLGWVVPAAIGLAIGFILRASRKAA